MQRLQTLLSQADRIAADNRDWVRSHAMFGPSVAAFMGRLRVIDPAAFGS